MNWIKRTVFYIFLAGALTSAVSGPACAGEVNLSMAASLRDVVTELEGIFGKNNPDTVFKNNSGASGAVAKQIENGAPADIFISANTDWMDHLRQKGLIHGKDAAVLAYNSIVFVGGKGLDVKSLQDLILLERIAIGSPKSVPAGEYAMAALERTGMAERLEKRLVMARDVRECLMYAERGEVDGAFVYRTDAMLASDSLTILFEVPQDLYPRVTYPMGLTSSGAGNKDAVAFFSFLRTQEAGAVLLRYGFITE